MSINNISYKIVFRMLKHIKYGVLKLTNYDNQKYVFGKDSSGLDVSLKINKPGFTYKIIKSGSVGLAEAYMKGDFETNNLSNLIELTAKNINIIYKFSGVFDFPVINMIKNFLVKNTKSKSKENIAKHYDLGNNFFSLWLDKSLTYSSAIFDSEKKIYSLLNIINI